MKCLVLLSIVLFANPVFAQDKTHEIKTIMGASATQEWWKTLAQCGGSLDAIGGYRKITKHQSAESNLSNAMLIGNWAVLRLMIDRKIDEKAAFPIASAQYIASKEFEKKEMEKAFKDGILESHFADEISKCEKYGNEYIQTFPDLFQ